MGYLRRYLAGPAGGPRLAAALIGLGLSFALAPSGQAQEGENPSDLAYVRGQLTKILEFERTAAEIPWKNPETKNGGVVRIQRTYYIEPDKPCRDYTRTVEKDGKEVLSIRGTGCRQDEGNWKLTEDSKPTRTVSRNPSAGGSGGAAGAKDAATGAAKPTDLKPDAKAAAEEAAAKEAAAKEAAAKEAAAKAAAAKPPPPPQIPVRLPRRTEEWEAGSEDG